MLCRIVIFSLLLSIGIIGQACAKQADLYDFVKPVTSSTDGIGQVEKTTQGESLRRLTFSTKLANPHFVIHSMKGKEWDISGYKTLSVRIQNAMDWDITLYVDIKDADGNKLRATVALPAGPVQHLLIPLYETSSRKWGMRGGLTKAWVSNKKRYLLPVDVSGKTDLGKVVKIDLSMDRPAVPQSILVAGVKVLDMDAEKLAYRHLIDKYGQNNRLNWSEKVTSDKALQKAAQSEQNQLKDWIKTIPHENKYGGMGQQALFKATGFFRVVKQKKQWYLVTPDGYPFISLGVNAVLPNASQTYISGRDFMFADLPSKNKVLARYYGYADTHTGNAAAGGRGVDRGRWFDFYQANLYRVAPQHTLDYWRRLTINRLKAWGFNTIGNWSDEALIKKHKLPYTIPILIKGDYASVPSGMDWWGYMPDTFDPKFAKAVDKAVALATQGRVNDPWLLGYFADNELSWGGAGDPIKGHYALAINTLALSIEKSPAKQAFIKQLKRKYKTADQLANAWGTKLIDWHALEVPAFKAPLPAKQHPAIAVDYSQFLTNYADGYFKTVRASLNKYDANHLWLGNRFASTIPEAITSCATYCDVVSMNLYTLLPQDGFDTHLMSQLNKPIMISEFSFGSKDKGSLWAGPLETANEKARSHAYANFVKAAFNEPYIVGVHWFQYIDEPITGRLLDGENGHLGLVGITNIPFYQFVEKVRQANLSLLQQKIK